MIEIDMHPLLLAAATIYAGLYDPGIGLPIDNELITRSVEIARRLNRELHTRRLEDEGWTRKPA